MSVSLRLKFPVPSLVRLGVAAAVAALAFGHAVHAIGQELAYKDPKVPVDARVKDLMGRMTLEEKIGQMVQADSTWLAIPDVSKYFLGSVLSGGDSEIPDVTPAGWYAYVERVQKQARATRLGLPVLYGIDAVHGHNNVKGATVFPHNIGLGATGGAMVNRSPYDGQPQSHINCILEVKEFERDESLVVIHGNHSIVTAPCSVIKKGVRWQGTRNPYSERGRLLESRYNDLLLFPAKESALTCVRVECGNSNPWVLQAEVMLQGAVCNTNSRKNLLFREETENIA